MGKHTVVELRGREASADPLTELLRAGAQRLIHQAVKAELQELLEAHSDRRTAHGKAGVVRNGYLPERELQTGVGPVPVRIPKVRAKTGDPVTFRSALVPPYARKTKSLEAALPWLYLKGISTGEMGEALAVLVGQEAKGLSASTVARLTKDAIAFAGAAGAVVVSAAGNYSTNMDLSSAYYPAAWTDLPNLTGVGGRIPSLARGAFG